MNPILLACHTVGQPTNYIRITGSARFEIDPGAHGMTIKSMRDNHSFMTFADTVEIVPELPSEATASNWTHHTP